MRPSAWAACWFSLLQKSKEIHTAQPQRFDPKSSIMFRYCPLEKLEAVNESEPTIVFPFLLEIVEPLG